MSATQLDLSDGLAAIIRAIEPTTSTGLVMTRRNVAVLLDGLRTLEERARELEAIADRAAWNDAARREAEQARRQQVAQAVEAGAVALLPVAPRATAIQRAPDGGAA